MPRKDPRPPAVRCVEQAFDAACRVLAPLRPGARLLLSCSAGGDSMALLHLMARRAPEFGWTLAVAHLDHAQRPESAAEAQWVAGQADALGIAPLIERLNVPPGLTEDAMRQARHAFLRRTAARWRADAVALAHQADDRAETFLIRLIAGSGPTGLSSVRAVERLDGLTLVRPLLTARRAHLRDWLRYNRLSWHVDATNRTDATRRGWIRNTILPQLNDRVGTDVAPRIALASELIENEAATLDEASRLLLNPLRQPADPPVTELLLLDRPPWPAASPHLRRQLLRRWLWDLSAHAHPPGLRTVEEALAFAERARPAAELRTVGRMHIVHLKWALAAFAPSVDANTRADAVARLRTGR